MAKSKAKRDSLRPQKRAPINDRQVELMLATFLRRAQAFESARVVLETEMFPDHHQTYAVVWSIVNDHYDEFGEMPSEDFIVGQIESRVEEDPDSLSDEEIEVTDTFLKRTFRIDDSAIREKVAFKLLRQYLDDRLIDEARRDFADGFTTPENVFSLLTHYQEKASGIDVLSHSGLPVPFEGGWDDTESLKVEKIHSGLNFFDAMMNGGMALTEVIGLMGPHGSCKTTISVQLCVDLAKQFLKEWEERDRTGPLKFVYMLIYEGTISEMRLRSLAHAATIDRSTLELGNPAILSRDGKLQPYEQQMFSHMSQRGVTIPGEFARYKLAQQTLNHNLRIIDMTGNDKNFPGRGHGLVPEIAQVIRGDQEHNARKGVEAEVGFISVDYVGAAVERHLEHNNLTRDGNLRYLLTKFPMHCKNRLAIAHNTAVLCVHQLSGQANALNPGVVAKGTDAAEAKSFRENLDFLFVVSNLNNEGRASINMDKHRRAPASSQEIIEVQGKFSRVTGTDGRYVFDQRRNQIVPRSALHQLAEVDDEEEADDYADGVPRNDSMDDETSQVSRRPSAANP